MTRKPKRSPSFFKVLIGDFDNKLRIPPAFVKYVLKGNVPTMFTLYSDSGNSWRVRVMVEEGSYFFNSGWSKFVKHHDLEIGDFLVFFLVDTSTFDVLIYNGTACPKNIILAAKKRKCLPPLANRQIEDTPSQKCASVSKKPKAVYRARSVNQEVESITEVTRKHVSFVMVVKKYHKYFACVPRCFAKETGLLKESITLIKGPRGGMWPMNTTECGKQVRLGGGWSQFLHENEIVVGDTLLFEHIPSTGNLVHVQIVNKDRYRNRGRRNKQADASVKNTSPAAKRPRVRPCKQIEEPPSTEHAPSSKRTKGVSIGNDEIVSELTPKKASFVMVLKEYQKYSAVVPTSFAKEMGLAEKPSTMIENSKGKKWLLNTIVDAKSQVRLGAGWSQLVQENKLELGDTLLFQHIPNTGNVINLKIICKVGDGNNRKRNK
ncbi:putative B3 domain-containing protein Os03g0621600 [Gossypium arboreum]|uniref:putative B3 domain-containing protein Os03g0621600 n=1 Tax=Gossypium arboreum TaxID=29729 RepID=UPI0022F18E38|nr:putative B3 domain-containing protein Os03g0621600 [Gossypium arboreum]